MITIHNQDQSDQTRINKEEENNIVEGEQSTLKVTTKRKGGPPDGGWGWVVVIASVFASLLGDGVSYSFGVFTTEFVEHFEASRGVIGFIGSIIIGTTLCSGPLVSLICNRWGYRIPTVVGALIASVGFAAPFFYDKLWFMIMMTSAVAGIGFGLIYLPSILIVNVYFEEKRALALGIAVCGSGIGTFIFGPLIELLISEYGWQGAMLIVSAILLNIVPCGLLYRSLKDDEQIEQSGEEKDNESLNEEIKSKPKSAICAVLSNPLFILFAMSNFLTSIGYTAPFMFVKDRAVVSGISSFRASLLISSIGIGNCIGRVLFGFLVTKRVFNGFNIYNISVIISGLFLVVSWGAANYYWMIGYTGFFGLMAGTYITLTSIVLVDLLGMTHLNLAFGFISVSQGVAEFMGPPMVGAVYDLTKSYDVAFAFCGAFLIFSGSMMFLSYVKRDFRERVKTFDK